MLEHENLAPGPPSPCAMILLHHATRNKNRQRATTTWERPRKNNRILRTSHHDPRPSRILSHAFSKSRLEHWEDLLRRFHTIFHDDRCRPVDCGSTCSLA